MALSNSYFRICAMLKIIPVSITPAGKQLQLYFSNSKSIYWNNTRCHAMKQIQLASYAYHEMTIFMYQLKVHFIVTHAKFIVNQLIYLYCIGVFLKGDDKTMASLDTMYGTMHGLIKLIVHAQILRDVNFMEDIHTLQKLKYDIHTKLPLESYQNQISILYDRSQW